MTTAERIRDKVAASKRKGMWMGGAVPMGYEVKDKALFVNDDGARSIRTIFAEYLALGSVRALSKRLDELGVVSKRRTDRHGRVTGGTSFSRGALYNILRNPTYIGKTCHKGEIYDGLHEAIIDDTTWQKVQAQLADHGGKRIHATRRPAKRSLDGLLFDTAGRPMRTTHASKSVRRDGATRTRRYWYYTSKLCGSAEIDDIERLPATEMENLVLSSLRDRLGDKAWLMDQLARASASDAPVAAIVAVAGELKKDLAVDDAMIVSEEVNRIIERIDVRQDRLRVHFNLNGLLETPTESGLIPGTFEVAFEKCQKGRAKPIVIAPKNAPHPDEDLINLIADARRWTQSRANRSQPCFPC